MDCQHVVLLGATGISGIAFINHHLTLSMQSRPYLTLYVRSSSKLPSSVKTTIPPAKTRIVTGELDSELSFSKAVSASDDFPPVTTAISLLGAYMAVGPVFSRFIFKQPTPIADAFKSTIIPVLKKYGARRILSLSTPTAVLSEHERKTIPWKPYLLTFLPIIMVPQGNEEMKGITQNTIESAGDEVEWTVFRVPMLTEEGDQGVWAGNIDDKYRGNWKLSREGQAKWLLQEIEERKWVQKTPMLNDA